MNFILVIIFNYFVLAGMLIYFLWRDRKNPATFCGQHKRLSLGAIILLKLGALFLVICLITPHILITNHQEIEIRELNGIKIALVSDMQFGMSGKRDKWAQKIVNKIKKEDPDLVLIAGDLVDNEGSAKDESIHIAPFGQLIGLYPTYYVMGNHEYGAGAPGIFQTGDRSALVAEQMEKLKIPLLKNKLECLKLKNQPLCIYGLDDIWGGKPNFDELNNWDKTTPIVLLAHIPDAILWWPKEIKQPDLVLAGHTHGGQIWLPLFGPLGDAQIILPKEFYRGLNYWNGVPVFTTVGAGESGGPVRFWVVPEVAVLKFK